MADPAYMERMNAPRACLTGDAAVGRWMGSTMSGYMQGDEQSFRLYFRVSQRQFGLLHDLIRSFPMWTRSTRADDTRTPAQRRRDTQRRLSLAHATSRFRVACCLYVYAHGGPLIHTSGVASVGVQTIRDWLRWFGTAIIACVRELYMPSTPPSAATVRLIRSEFASRQGIPNVALACDGTHVPYFPRIAEYASDFVNYKGWKSILVVAFVDSFHLFRHAEVGAPGRAGDNSVLRTSQILEMLSAGRDVWLGPGGVIAADGGATDADDIFLNPYHNPRSPERVHFNFCHSSTRFFVEEVFGRWKNRFRFLLDPCHMGHSATNLMIFTSMVLHNFITIERRREDHAGLSLASAMMTPDVDHHTLTVFDGSDRAWIEFFSRFASEICPACAARNSYHCAHMAAHRNQHGYDGPASVHLQAHLRGFWRPSEMRDSPCDRLWRQLTASARGGMASCPNPGQRSAPESSSAAGARARQQEMHSRAERASATGMFRRG